MVADPREVRDARRQARLLHLAQRRTGGEALVGGQSEATTPLSSDSGFVEAPIVAEGAIETPGIAISAVNSFLVLEDTLFISTGAYNSNITLVSLDVIGSGVPLQITFTDEYAPQSTGITDQIGIVYTIEVLYPGGATFVDPDFGLASASQLVLFIQGPGVGFPDLVTLAAYQPNMQLLATLPEGQEFEVRVHWSRTRDNAASDDIFAHSLSRRLIIQEIKR